MRGSMQGDRQVGLPSNQRCAPLPFDHGEPISRVVLAPLAGVVLIAATLIASTYGVRTHAFEIDLPYPSQEEGETRLGISADLVRIDRLGAFYWNGSRVSQNELERILKLREDDRKSAGLRFSPDPDASYESVLAALWLVKTSGNAEAGFCFGNHHQHRDFERSEKSAEYELEPTTFACDQSKDGRLDKPMPYMPTI